ncbi:MAG TPA: hypothetical protein VNW53_05870 [Phenylobacterium sp.]|jgi:hypothetical protein|uniref:hypothetical protein n=1 Tax=Phenylobacterium sp. TaxID=1871053 RepID=UPI002BCFADBD|nr:hypothetical protein [Phenylobacterium sp.]HXA38508.1 hypothetical protein [Phenylobacterium sp.]
MKTILPPLIALGLSAHADAQPAAPAAGRPEAATAAAVSAATGASVSELVVVSPPKPATVSELDVVAHVKCVPPRKDARGRAPQIVGVYPKDGAVVRPGLLILRVTFDQPMSCAGYFVFDDGPQNPCGGAGRVQHMLMTFDRRTIRTACLLSPNTRYSFSMNEARPTRFGALTPAEFVSMTGWPMERVRLTFTASAEPVVATVREALGEDPETRLTPADR